MPKLIIAMFLILSSGFSYADCMADRIGLVHCGQGECRKGSDGKVHCSKYVGGGAEVDGVGTVQCGKGKCVENSVGVVYCSKLEGGGAALDGIGGAKCYGGCQSGSRSMCERVQGT